jgi:hypothetical protein
VHIFDTPYRALQLTAPHWVETSCRPPTGIGHPEANRVTYEFPGTPYTTETLRWIWYDGAQAPPPASELRLPEGVPLPDQGSLFIGQEGSLLLPHVAEPILWPEDRFADVTRPPLERVNHYHQWVDACMGHADATAHFGYAGPLTEALLLGVVANRFPNQRLTWDTESMRVTNLDEANALLRRSYRDGFEVAGL